MLNSAIKSLKAGKEPDIAEPLHVTTEINLHTPALLPNDYCADVHERLVLYKRLAHCETSAALDTLHEELIDRFGLPPPQTKALLDTHRLRILAKPLGIARIDASGESVTLQFIKNPPIDPGRIIHLNQTPLSASRARQA
jgi:transcription-repair coupling factor (superfamily II helicase)